MHELIRELYSEQPTGELYHYTNSGGFLGIVQSHSIWATEVRYLNDATELSNTLERIGGAAREVISEVHGHEAECLGAFPEWCRYLEGSGLSMFVTSLTRNGNLLSQWRGYSTGGQGYSIRFDASRLCELADRQGFRIGRCMYDHSGQDSIAKRIVSYVRDAYARFDWKGTHVVNPARPFDRFFQSLEADIITCAALLKNPAFLEEDEWRLISPLFARSNQQGFRFRPARSCLVPYMTFNLKGDDEQLTAITGAIVGPSNNPDQAIMSASMLLGQHLSTFTISNPKVPLREV